MTMPMNVHLLSCPPVNRKASATPSAAEPRYVPEIIGLRPTVSKSRPMVSGPAKLASAYKMTNTGTTPDATWKNVVISVPRLKVIPL